MSIAAERFAQGLTYEAYKAQMTRNQERLEQVEQTVVLEQADLAPFNNLPQPLNVLVLAEDWCGDVIANLPILGRIAAASGKLNVRVFLRDQNLDLMDQYLKNGEFRSIPVFVFFDDDFNEIGHMIERPDSVSEVMNRKRQEIYAQNPAFGTPDTPIAQLPEDARVRLMQAFNTLREEQRTFSDHELIRELQAIVAQAKG